MHAERDQSHPLAPVGYVTTDEEGVIEDINPLGARMLGLHRHWLVGHPLKAYTAEGSRQALEEHLQRCRVEPGPVESELWLAPPEGEPRYVQVITQPSADQEGRYCYTALVDQTERYRAERDARENRLELEKLNELLTHRNEQLRALTLQLTQAEQRERRNLSELLHDRIQGLLVGAWMQVDRLRDTEPDKLAPAVDRILGTLDEAVHTSRSLSRELSPRVVYDVGLAGSLRWLAQRTREDLQMDVSVEADDRADVENDDVRVVIFQAVQELLLNVAKHAETDQAWVRSRLVGEETVEVEVEDRGKGIDPHSIQSRNESAGLGLFGTRERLTWLGGGMTVEGKPGQGTRITLWVPRTAGSSIGGDKEDEEGGMGEDERAELMPSAANGGASEAARKAKERAGAGSTPGTGAHRKRGDEDRPFRILIADDHAIVRDSIAHLINLHEDCAVAGVAEDGNEALEMARDLEVDVVVMDVNMSGMDGIEATIQLTEENPEIRVIGLTMMGDSAVEDAMVASGAEAVLSKSAATQRLIEQICGHADIREDHSPDPLAEDSEAG